MTTLVARTQKGEIILSFKERAPREHFKKVRDEAPFIFGPALQGEVEPIDAGLEVVRIRLKKTPTKESWAEAMEDFKKVVKLDIEDRVEGKLKSGQPKSIVLDVMRAFEDNVATVRKARMAMEEKREAYEKACEAYKYELGQQRERADFLAENKPDEDWHGRLEK